MRTAGNTRLILAAMIFAVSMTFIDQTIVSLAIPELQRDLGLSSTGTQWIINAYLLSLAAFFAFGGRLADIAGHRRMLVVGVLVFAGASALCGATPTDADVAEPWMITFRVVQGLGAAFMFPAALAIVVAAFPVAERGKALAIVFGITGGLTALGPFLGGYLTEWTWRSIFWINVPVAIIALVLTYLAKPDDTRHPAPIDWRGTALIAAGMGLSVLGLQQSSEWGWTSPATIGCIAAGLLLLALFVRLELRTRTPLINVNIFRDRGFAAANAVLFLFSMVFVPVFFFTSMYAQISVGDDASSAGLFLLVFFAGFGGAAQWGGRVYDERGVRAAALPGCVLGAVGFFLWAQSLDDFQLGDQWIWVVMAGAGCGLILGPVSTDALNRVAATRYGEATGITQTVRNFGASIGLAVLGTILIMRTQSNVEGSLGALGVPKDRADEVADALTRSSGGQASGGFGEHAGPAAERAFAAVRTDFADATQTVFYVMAGVMVAVYVLAHVWLPRDRAVPDAALSRDAAG